MGRNKREEQHIGLLTFCRLCHGLLIFGFLLPILVWQVKQSMKLAEHQQRQPVYRINPTNYTYTYPIYTLPANDYNRLIDLDDFHFLIMNNVCNDSSNPLLLILIHSAPHNFERRKVVRQTWGQSRDGVKIIFMVGYVRNDTLLEKLQKENEIHRDLTQGSFMDSYRNMTYKHVMVLKYVVYHCPEAKYILKSDDDVFVNIDAVFDYLRKDLSTNGVSDLILCDLQKQSKVLRDKKSKWRVSVSEYPDEIFPPYCLGFALIYSPDVVFSLYRETQRSSYFWIDDVHVTGTMAKKAKITHTDASGLILYRNDMNSILRGNNYYPIYLYGPPNIKADHITGLWNVCQRRANRKFKYSLLTC